MTLARLFLIEVLVIEQIQSRQLLALNTFKKDEKLIKLIEEMKEHDKEHFEYFDKEIQKRNIIPTICIDLKT